MTLRIVQRIVYLKVVSGSVQFSSILLNLHKEDCFFLSSCVSISLIKHAIRRYNDDVIIPNTCAVNFRSTNTFCFSNCLEIIKNASAVRPKLKHFEHRIVNNVCAQNLIQITVYICLTHFYAFVNRK